MAAALPGTPADSTEPHPVEPNSDGRRQRRDRNRDAVVRALLSLYNEGNLDPSTEEIATRSGVSARSLFRYFDDVNDLCQAAIEQLRLDNAHLFPVQASPDMPFDERLAAVAQQRCELFEAVESAAIVSRLRAPFQLVVAEGLTSGRAYLRKQLQTLFAPELAAMTPSLAAARLAAADVATSFESWRLLRDDQHLTRPKATAVFAEALAALLSIPAPTQNMEIPR